MKQTQAGDPDGAERLRKVHKYVALTRQPGSAPVVTAAAFSDDLVVIDGNHSAMAAYPRAAENGPDRFELPIFILKTDLSSAALP